VLGLFCSEALTSTHDEENAHDKDENNLGRRALLATGVAGLALSVFGRRLPANASDFEFTLSEAEWRARLTPKQYGILREEDTERPFTSALNNEKRKGMYHCAGCDLPAYSSEAKYDSGTGWPSFWQAEPDAVRTKPDPSPSSASIRKCIAGVAAATSATSLMTARRQPASAIASTALR
jgi:peptide methionine sulfoxide reductase MsrB